MLLLLLGRTTRIIPSCCLKSKIPERRPEVDKVAAVLPPEKMAMAALHSLMMIDPSSSTSSMSMSSHCQMGMADPSKALQSNLKMVKMRRKSIRLGSDSSSKPTQEYEEDNKNDISSSSSNDDLNYFLQLGGISVGGGVVIKYGSALFPAITTPNITLALIMVTTPMLIAVLLMIKHSRA